jgi:hypothetical protein
VINLRLPKLLGLSIPSGFGLFRCGLMSALGQKQTCAVHQPTSALPPKADIGVSIGRSAKSQKKRTFVVRLAIFIPSDADFDDRRDD